jgi:hypothetical protein
MLCRASGTLACCDRGGRPGRIQVGTDQSWMRAVVGPPLPLELTNVKGVREHLVQVGF